LAVDSATTLVAHIRTSRRRARALAAAEIVAVLTDLGAEESPGGPLSEVGGVTWVRLPRSSMDAARPRLRGLGYSQAIDEVRTTGGNEDSRDFRAVVRWRGQDVGLVRIYDEPDVLLNDSSPDRRTFLLECGDGMVRAVEGYRGGRGPLDHRALPVVDARLLVNLVWQSRCGYLLDPYAGAGGVLIAAKAAGWTTISLDIDPHLRFGLASVADAHFVGTAAALPIRSSTVDAIASEPPFHSTAEQILAASLPEMARVLRPGGHLALLVTPAQAGVLRDAALKAGFQPTLQSPIDRKGAAMECLRWTL